MPRKISQLEAATDVTASDLIQIVDIEDTGMATSGTNKKCTAQLMANELGKLTNITATGSTTARSLANRFADVVNVKDFGAVGDGVTDDTAAIVLAASSGSRIYLPSGTYIFSNSTMPSEFDFIGAGSGKTTILWKAASASSNMMNLSGVVDVRFTDITIDSNRQNQTDSTGYYGAVGGTIGNGSKIIFDRVEFKNGRITDVVLVGPTGAGQFAIVEFNQCQFYDGLVGTDTRAAQAVSVSEGIRLSATGNTFRQPNSPASYGRGGLVMQRPGGSTSLSWGQFNASNNKFDNFGRGTSADLGCIYVYSGSEATTILGNILTNSYGTAITVKADCGPTSVVGNTINTSFGANSAAMAFYAQGDIYTSSIGRDFVITNNAIRNPEQDSIFFDGERNGLSDLTNVIINNNICDGGLRGVRFRNVKNIKIKGNVISNTTGVAVIGGDCSGYIDISGNTIDTGLVGIDINGSTNDARFCVSDNNISGLTATAFRLQTIARSFCVNNNEVSGCGIAFDTRGSTEFSTIRNNVIRGETAVWDKSGTYNGLQYDSNITSTTASFVNVRQLTISSGSVTAYADWHYIETEGASSTDDLDTINGGYEGRRLILYAANSGRDVVLKDGTGNLRLAGDYTLTHADDSIELVFRNNVWVEISRSDNNA